MKNKLFAKIIPFIYIVLLFIIYIGVGYLFSNRILKNLIPHHPPIKSFIGIKAEIPHENINPLKDGHISQIEKTPQWYPTIHSDTSLKVDFGLKLQTNDSYFIDSVKDFNPNEFQSLPIDFPYLKKRGINIYQGFYPIHKDEDISKWQNGYRLHYSSETISFNYNINSSCNIKLGIMPNINYYMFKNKEDDYFTGEITIVKLRY